MVEQPDVKINDTAGNITESLHDQQSNVMEEIEPEETLVVETADDPKLRKRRSVDSMSDEDMLARYNRLVEGHKKMVDEITESCDTITLDNICDDFGWDKYIGKLGPPPPMGPPICESCGEEVTTTVEPEETTTPVESTTTTVATTTTTVAPTTVKDSEPTSPATHETVTVTEPCDPTDICDPCNDSFDIPPPPIPPMYPGANCTGDTDECTTTAQPTTTETEPLTTTEEPPDPTEPPTTQQGTTECPGEDFCCEEDIFPPVIVPPPEFQCKRQVFKMMLNARYLIG